MECEPMNRNRMILWLSIIFFVIAVYIALTGLPRGAF